MYAELRAVKFFLCLLAQWWVHGSLESKWAPAREIMFALLGNEKWCFCYVVLNDRFGGIHVVDKKGFISM
jgi:hypothetical protein